MRISDWSSDVCSSDLVADHAELHSNKRFALHEGSFALPSVTRALSAHGFKTVLVLDLPSESGAGFTLVLAARAVNAFSHDAHELLGNLAPVIAHGFEKSALSEQLLLDRKSTRLNSSH